VPALSAGDFAALARSSPWRWSTLRFTEGRVRPDARSGLRAWLRRPDAVRVESLGGALLQIVHEPRPSVAVPGDLAAPAPTVRPDGLVAVRPSTWELSYDAPMYHDYFWVAMLDPVELADGLDHDSGEAAGPPLLVDTVTEVDHGGRPAWEAVVRPTPVYEPRCACCPLLRTREIDLLEYGAPMLDEYPEAFRVRLDVETGVCVLTAEIGGLAPGAGHDVRIEAVDEPMDDELFRDRRPLQPTWGWSQYPRPT
jgi:hypothetical protein